jgi:hypothetical protein
LCPGAEDLQAIGANLMDPSRRIEVLDTARRTVAASLVSARPAEPEAIQPNH